MKFKHGIQYSVIGFADNMKQASMSTVYDMDVLGWNTEYSSRKNETIFYVHKDL